MVHLSKTSFLFGHLVRLDCQELYQKLGCKLFVYLVEAQDEIYQSCLSAFFILQAPIVEPM